MKIITMICCLGLLLFGVAGTSYAITNGSFETGDFTGWTTYGNAYVAAGAGGYVPEDGTYLAYLIGGSANVYQTISQTIFSINAGDTIDGYAAFDSGDYIGDNAYVKIFDSSNALIATPWYQSDFTVGSYNQTPWQNWSWTASASGNYFLQFGVENYGDSILTPYAFFDDIGGGGGTAVPEPTIMLLLGTGLLGLFGLKRKFRK